MASYLHSQDYILRGNRTIFIYVEVAATLGVVFSILFLIPGPRGYIELALDFTLFILLITAFGVIAHVCQSISQVIVRMLTK